jgi:hypothetical protein
MVVHKPLMARFLQTLQTSDDKWSWVVKILSNLPADHLMMGFSEFASFVSWVKQTYPERQQILPRKTWRRQPVGGAWGIWLAVKSHPNGLCCPTRWQHALEQLLGLDYYGFELGHHKLCRFKELSIAGTYGLTGNAIR